MTLADPAHWAAGIAVVLDAQDATALPDPAKTPPWALAQRVAARQSASLGVWLATMDGLVVGHALVQPVSPDHPDWSTITEPNLRRALAKKRLVELGGLAVHPSATGLGVATALVEARLRWLANRPALVAVASVWDASAASTRLADRHADRVGAGSQGAYSLYVYRRPATATHPRA